LLPGAELLLPLLTGAVLLCGGVLPLFEFDELPGPGM
jgi:hypothetical protein